MDFPVAQHTIKGGIMRKTLHQTTNVMFIQCIMLCLEILIQYKINSQNNKLLQHPY